MFETVPAVHKKFVDIFPPPKYLEMLSAGIDIGDTKVRFLEFVKKGRRYVLGRYGEKNVPPGVITGGYVNKKEEIIRILSEIRSECGFTFVNIALPEEKAYVFKERVPAVLPEELRQAVEFTLEENVPIPATEAVYDYVKLSSSSEEHVDVGVSVLPVKVVKTYEEIVKSAGFRPLLFTTEAQAIAQAVVGRTDTGTAMIVNFEENKTGLYIVCEGVVLFASTVDIGSGAITNAIAKHYSVSREEAEEIKRKKGFIKDRKNMDLFFSLMNTVSALKDEIGKLSIYWATHKDKYGETGKKIDRIILCGKDAGLEGFDEYLSLTMKAKIEVANIWQNALSFEEGIPALPLIESLDFAAAAGAALPKYARYA